MNQIKTVIDLIKNEQIEQRSKHGFTEQHDRDEHYEGGLQRASLYALTLDAKYKQRGFEKFESKMQLKLKVERLVIASALLASE
ncbi:MAG: hypothetical protein AABY22_15660, partial [Nanoarchaeota archaeon]